MVAVDTNLLEQFELDFNQKFPNKNQFILRGYKQKGIK